MVESWNTAETESFMGMQEAEVLGHKFYIYPYSEDAANCIQPVKLVDGHRIIVCKWDDDSQAGYIVNENGRFVKRHPLLDIFNNSEHLERVSLESGSGIFVDKKSNSSWDNAFEEVGAIIEVAVV